MLKNMQNLNFYRYIPLKKFFPTFRVNPFLNYYKNIKLIFILSFLIGSISCGIVHKSPKIEYFLDTENKLSIVDVLHKKVNSFQELKDPSIRLGYYEGTVWIKLLGKEIQPENYFEIDNPNLTEINYYIVNPKESIAYEKIGGRYTSSIYKDIDHKNHIFQIERTEGLDYYFKIRSNTPLNLRIHILDIKNLVNENMFLDVQYGIFIGTSLFILIFLFNLFFIKRQFYLIYLISFLILNFISFYEKWMIFPSYSISYHFDTSFLDHGLEPLIYIGLILFSYFLLDLKNRRLITVSIIFPFFFTAILLLGKVELYFYMIKSLGILIGLYVISLIFWRYKKTNHFLTFLFISWIILIVQYIFELWNYLGNLNFVSSTTFNLIFLFLEACFFILCIHFQESADSNLNFDPTLYIQTEPDFKISENLISLDNHNTLLTKDNHSILSTNNTISLKINLICQFFKSADDSKIDFFYNSQLDYLSKYPNLNFSIQKYEYNYSLVLFQTNENSGKFIRDFCIFNYYLEKDSTIKIYYGLDQKDIQFEFNKKSDTISNSHQIFKAIQLLADISSKVNLRILTFFDFAMKDENSHKKRFIGKIKNLNNEASNVWEYDFIHPDLPHFESFAKGLNLYKKKNYKVALEFFQKALEENSNDEISKLYVRKTQIKIEPSNKTKEGEDLFYLEDKDSHL
jgi:hypothetical protein